MGPGVSSVPDRNETPLPTLSAKAGAYRSFSSSECAGRLVLAHLYPFDNDVGGGAVPRIPIGRRDGLDHVHALGHFAEDRVLTREPRSRRDGNEKLRSVRVGTRVRHSEEPRPIELGTARGTLVFE